MNRVYFLFKAAVVLIATVGCVRTDSQESWKNEPLAEHALLVYLKLSDDGIGTFEERNQIQELSDRLEAAIDDHIAGEFDGDEFSEGQCTLFMYGPDADALFAAIEPLLRDSPLSSGGHVIKRYGDVSDANAIEVRVDF